MKRAMCEKESERRGDEGFMVPHAFNYMIKEEIFQRLDAVDTGKVERIKTGQRMRSGCAQSRKLAEKIMGGI